jgi:3'-5' exonuclease
VQALWDAGRLDEIHAYCRRDVIQTYFLFLRVELMRGRITPEEYEVALAATTSFRSELEASGSGAA